MELEKAIETIKKDPKKSEEFAKDPKKVLQEMGVSVQGLTIEKSGELSDEELENVAGGAGTRCQIVGTLGRCQTVGV